jgi:hypothetical protein
MKGHSCQGLKTTGNSDPEKVFYPQKIARANQKSVN